MTIFLSRLIALIMIPIFYCNISPVALVNKRKYAPKEVISLSENKIGTKKKPVYVTAHRGGNTDAPENSLSAFKSSIEKGYYASECDVWLTADKHWVVTHDDNVNKHFWGVGQISKMTFEDVRKLTYRLDTNYYNCRKEKIPSLEEYLDLFIDAKTRPEIEIKTNNNDELETIVKMIESRKLTKKAIIISFNYEQLKHINKLNKNIETWYLVGEITSDIVKLAKKLPSCTTISARGADNTKESIALATKAGLKVAVWTINTVEEAKMYYDMGATHIVSDILGV